MEPSTAFIVTHTIQPGEEATYEAWLTEMLSEVSHAPGYLGREVFRPAPGLTTYTSIVRFSTNNDVQAWIKSHARSVLLARIEGLLSHGDRHEVRTGIDFWFTPATAKPPKSWKQFLLVLSAIYPLSQLVPLLLAPLFQFAGPIVHPLLKALLNTAAIVALMTFAIMPHYTRLVKRWLYRESTGR
ncbi:MAG: antibiotic biosynthesis monooxygenase [Bryobacteraceae bacterium]